MIGLVWFIFCFLLLLGALAYLQLPLWGWTVLVGLFLFVGGLGFLGWIVWPLFIVIAIGMNAPELRRRYFSNRIFYWFSKQLPAMSKTEREAIEAGDISWEKELFQGKPNWDEYLAIPKPALSESEQSFLDNQVETLCGMLNDWEIVHERSDLPPQVWDYLKAEKFFGMIIPKKYGGLEFSHNAHSCVITKIATRSISAAVTAMVPNSLGPAELLLEYGTEEQKEYYLPRLANGEEIPCFALTGPEAGSDASSILDKGIVCKGMHEGNEVVGIRLTFDKRYITLAPIATVLGLAFKLYDPENLIGDKKNIGITVCLIPMDHYGVESGSRHFPLNLAFMNGPVRGQDVFVPLEWIIGGVAMSGQGWRMLMECLAAGRGVSLPAMSTATGILASRVTGAYAAIRRQFSLPIGAFEGVEAALGRIMGLTYLLQATRLFMISALDQKLRPAVATAIAKYHMTEMARKVINDAMDVHGGRGIMMGPANYLGRGYQGTPVSITVEGANILTRSLIIFGQGAIRCHPFVKKEMRAAQDYEANPKQALEQFDETLLQHLGYFVANLSRTIFLSVSGGHFYWGPIKDNSKKYVKKINWLSAGLALASDVTMLMLGGALKRKESVSARLGDILSQLYLACATLKFYIDEGKQEVAWPMTEWALQTCLFEAQEAFFALLHNYPSPIVGKILQWVIFPYGKVFTLPHDSLFKELAHSITTPSAIRESLTALCYIGKGKEDPTGVVEMAFYQSVEVRPLIDKITLAVKNKEIKKNIHFEEKIDQALQKHIIDKTEAKKLHAFEKLRQKVIAVDEFNADTALGTKSHEEHS
jgi:alkylation response protein AidB-like acyl-CoA dehydrogenase